MPKTYGAWSNEIKLVFSGGNSSSSSSRSSSSRSSSPSSSSAVVICKNVSLELINNNNTYSGEILNPPVQAVGNVITAKITDNNTSNNFVYYEIFVDGERYVTTQKEMQFILDLGQTYEFSARSVCETSPSSSTNLGNCINTTMIIDDNGTIYQGEINEPPAQATNNKLLIKLGGVPGANTNNLSFWEVAINEKVYTVPVGQNTFALSGVAGSIYNIQARSVCEINPSSSSSSLTGGGGGSSSTTTIGCNPPAKVLDIESDMSNMKLKRYLFQFCILDPFWKDTNAPTDLEINNKIYSNVQTFIQWRLLKLDGTPSNPIESQTPWITTPYFFNPRNTATNYTIKKFAHVKDFNFIEGILVEDLLNAAGGVEHGEHIIEFRFIRTANSPQSPNPNPPIAISHTFRHQICLKGVYTDGEWICPQTAGTECFGRDVAGSRDVPACGVGISSPVGVPNLFDNTFQTRNVPEEEGNPGGGRPIDIDRGCGTCLTSCTSSSSATSVDGIQGGNLLGNCYKNQTTCGNNPFPIFNTFKVFCHSIGGYFVPAGTSTPLVLKNCTNISQTTLSSSSSLSSVLIETSYLEPHGPIEYLPGFPR